MTIPPPCQPSFYHHHHYTTQLNTLPTAASTQDIHQHPKTQQPVRLIKNQLGSSLLIFTFIITSSSSAVSASVLWHCFLADSNTLFTRWSWLDELALIEPAPHASFANVYRMLLTRWARQTTCSSQALVERSWSARGLTMRFQTRLKPRALMKLASSCKRGLTEYCGDEVSSICCRCQQWKNTVYRWRRIVLHRFQEFRVLITRLVFMFICIYRLLSNQLSTLAYVMV